MIHNFIAILKYNYLIVITIVNQGKSVVFTNKQTNSLQHFQPLEVYFSLILFLNPWITLVESNVGMWSSARREARAQHAF